MISLSLFLFFNFFVEFVLLWYIILKTVALVDGTNKILWLMVYIYQFLIYGLFTSFPLVHLQRFVENCKYRSTFNNIQECVKDVRLDHLGK